MQADDTGGSLTFISELETDVSVQVDVVPPAATGAKWRKGVCFGREGDDDRESRVHRLWSDAADSVAREAFPHRWRPG